MSVDDVTKLLLAGAISFSIVGISIQLMRLLGSFNDVIQDVRSTVRFIGELAHRISGDYKNLREGMANFLNPIQNMVNNVTKPLNRLTKVLGGFTDMITDKITGVK